MDQSDGRSVPELPLPPGFRFYPTDGELVWHYLRKKADSEAFQLPIIAEVNIYNYDPWDLPRMALFGEKEWFFFSPRDRKYPKGSRPNRAAASGFWKATGTDKPIYKSSRGHEQVGVKKSLAFYRGRALKGDKTNWRMHEYRLAEGVAPSAHHHRRGSRRLDDWVLCRIYEKFSHAQRVCQERDTESIAPESDTPELQNSLDGADSAARQKALLEDMLADITPETGSLTTSLPMMNNPGGMAVHMLSNAWEPPPAVASTSHGRNHRFTQELAASQTLTMPSMAGQFPSYNSYTDLHSPISDEDTQGAFQSSVYGFAYPPLGYDHHADHEATTSYSTPGSTENPLHPGTFDFPYGPPGNNNNNNFN